MTDLSRHSVCVLLFIMDGCGACEDYEPRLRAQATPLLRAGLSILVYRADDPRPDVQALMNGYDIQATPTTVVLRLQNGVPHGGPMTLEGGLDDTQIGQLLAVVQQNFVPPR